jgi:hypothetical protein
MHVLVYNSPSQGVRPPGDGNWQDPLARHECDGSQISYHMMYIWLYKQEFSQWSFRFIMQCTVTAWSHSQLPVHLYILGVSHTFVPLYLNTCWHKQWTSPNATAGTLPHLELLNAVSAIHRNTEGWSKVRGQCRLVHVLLSQVVHLRLHLPAFVSPCWSI